MIMSPMGLGTKNHCAGEVQLQFSRQSVSQSVSQLRVDSWCSELVAQLITQQERHKLILLNFDLKTQRIQRH
jgi:hypothetical protein